MHTVNGNQSNYFLHTLSGELSYSIIKELAITSEAGYFALSGRYKDDIDTNKRYPYLKFAARYKLDL